MRCGVCTERPNISGCKFVEIEAGREVVMA
jgi:hypothetical protein